MSAQTIEERLTAVEIELQKLKQEKARDEAHKEAIPWWEQIRGQFKDDPDYLEAMRLGREWRESEDRAAEGEDKC